MDDWNNRLAHGDSAAFTELYDRCADRVHHYLSVRLGSSEEASDVLQEVFLRLARHRRKFAKIDRPESYAFIVARNESSRRIARRNRERRMQEPLKLFEEVCSDDLVARQRAEWATHLLERLPPKEREIVELRIYGCLTFAEAANVTGVPQGTLASRYRTALQRLRDCVARESP